MLYVPVPPLAVVVKVTVWPRTKEDGLGVGDDTAGPATTVNEDEVATRDEPPFESVT